MKIMRTMLIAAAAIVAMAGSAFAQERPANDLRFCSGGKSGMYYQVASEIGTRLASTGTPPYHVVRVESPGSNANLRLMMNPADPKTCDVAIAQNDAIRNFFVKDPSAKNAIVRGAPLYDEAVHFICNKAFADANGISRVPDIRKFGKPGNKVNFSIAIGSPNSGVNETWTSIGDADADYKKVPTTTDSGLRAIEKIMDASDTQCMIYTAALNTSFMKDVNKNYAGKVILLGFDDKDLDNAKDAAGKPIYRIGEIPSGTYDGIQPGGSLWGTKSVKTAFVTAHLIFSRNWDDRSGGGVDDLIKAKNAAMPTIEKMVRGENK